MTGHQAHDAHFRGPGADLPFPLRAVKALARPFARHIELSSDAVVRRALRGLPSGAGRALEFREALDALCHSMDCETQMHTLGRITARADTARLVRTQIEINLELARSPEILETPLPRPIYVIGWPRTGTTVLHTLLAQDPAHRALRYFEGFDPVAPARGGADLRSAQLQKMLRGLEYMQPGYRAIHPMDPDSIEECVTVLYHTFSTPQFDFQYHCPSYHEFLERQGPRAAYAHYRKQLQMLQHYRPYGERWVLKDPTHLIALDTLLELFPDAQFVWIHRDPVRALTSIASLTAHTRSLFSDAYDAEMVGQEVTSGFWPREMLRGLELREKLPAERFIDVRYADFMANPIGSVGAIYDRLGLELRPEARRAMECYLREHAQGSEGVHRHSPEQFGIDPETEWKRYADYSERFELPRETPRDD
ncbi:MAG: sulfotransferase [Deltaproteobacteria bacterium]|nr:sulfotransferase [Deltaproteobacteria bacterium]MBW2359858.1 sulfotransferase [Deltaproteobacteria bacterium]